MLIRRRFATVRVVGENDIDLRKILHIGDKISYRSIFIGKITDVRKDGFCDGLGVVQEVYRYHAIVVGKSGHPEGTNWYNITGLHYGLKEYKGDFVAYQALLSAMGERRGQEIAN
ncbi:MAG: hypothetical protein LUD07_07885 [Clostridiales bacterium]|nr:hypothetical protein [Clostridiales bacterium]